MLLKRVFKGPTWFFLLSFCLFVLFSLPNAFSTRIRSFFWITSLFSQSQTFDEKEFLELENLVLKERIDEIKLWLESSDLVETRLNKIEEIQIKDSYKEFSERRKKELICLLESEIFAIPATVVFRDPSFWSSIVWIDKGDNWNQKIGQNIIAKNSPVVCGTDLIGVIEEVLSTRSKVRLITDNRLMPSVRVVRGGEVHTRVCNLLDELEESLETFEDVGLERSSLASLKEKLEIEDSKFFAKGVIRGTSQPLWRSLRPVLKGMGFNYDFTDAERVSGMDLHGKGKLAIIQVGDLLITSGMDGIFPKGLHVARVSKVFPLHEGGYCYDIEAKPVAYNLNELSSVQILPSKSEKDFL